MKKSKRLTASMEDYLEAIAVLKRKNHVARVRDIGELLNVKKSSVTAALTTLSQAGLVVHERYGYVELTCEGEQRAAHIQKRHDLLVQFLTEILHIDTDIAMVDACKMEHVMSPETFKRLSSFMQYIETCPAQDGPTWLKNFNYYLNTKKNRRLQPKKKR